MYNQPRKLAYVMHPMILLVHEDRPCCRFYEAGGQTQTCEALRRAIGTEIEVTDLTGKPLSAVTPYMIGYLLLPEIAYG